MSTRTICTGSSDGAPGTITTSPCPTTPTGTPPVGPPSALVTCWFHGEFLQFHHAPGHFYEAVHKPLPMEYHEAEPTKLYLPWMETLSKHCSMRFYYFVNGWTAGDLE